MTSREIILQMLRALPLETLGEFVRRMPDDELEGVGRSVFGSLADGTGDAPPVKPKAKAARGPRPPRPKTASQVKAEAASNTSAQVRAQVAIEKVYKTLAKADDGLPASALVEATDLTEYAVKHALRALKQDGRATCSGKKSTTRWSVA